MKVSPPNPFPPGARPPAPPPELRERVLRAASLSRPEPAPPWWARPAVRWAWAAAMALVLAGHLYLSLSRRISPPPAVGVRWVATLERFDDPVLASCALGGRATGPQLAPDRRRGMMEQLLKGDLR